jgi:hypothetical protein
MNTEMIRDLLFIYDKYPQLSKQLSEIIKMAIDPEDLTTDEIRAGREEGRIAAIRKYFDRHKPNKSLIEAKRTVEKYFEDNNLTFGH